MIGLRSIVVIWAGLQLLFAIGLAIWDFSLWPAVLLALAAVPALLVAASGKLPGAGDVSAEAAPRSLACPVLAAGLTMVAVGLMAGLWFALIGVEVAIFGLFLLIFELRAGRRVSP